MNAAVDSGTKRSPRFAVSAALVVAVALSTKVLGFVSDQIVAAYFGASAVTDAYVLAITFSVFVFSLLGADTASTMVPTLTSAANVGGEEQLGRATGDVVVTAASVSALAIALILLLSSWIVPFIASGAPPETVDLTQTLIFIVIPPLLFMIAGAFIASALAATRHFVAPTIGPALTNVLIILSAVWLSQRYGVVALSVATAIGTVCGATVNWVTLRLKGVRLRLRIPLRSSAVAQLGRLAWPAVIANGALQLAIMVDRSIAAAMSVGTISALNFAFKLMQLPFGLFTAVAPVLLSYLSEAAVKAKTALFGRRLRLSMISALVLTLPVATVLFVEAEAVVRLAFERGAFLAADTLNTAGALRWYALAVSFHVLNFLLIRAHYAVQRTKATLWAIAAGVGANIVGDIVLAGLYGHVGIAAANLLHAVTLHVVLVLSMRHSTPDLDWLGLYCKLGTVVMGAVAMGASMKAIELVYPAVPTTTLDALVHLSGVCILGLVVYAGWCLLIRIPQAIRRGVE